MDLDPSDDGASYRSYPPGFFDAVYVDQRAVGMQAADIFHGIEKLQSKYWTIVSNSDDELIPDHEIPYTRRIRLHSGAHLVTSLPLAQEEEDKLTEALEERTVWRTIAAAVRRCLSLTASAPLNATN